MPCFGDSWDVGLEPGTPEYLEEERRIRLKLESVLHVADYYCRLHDVGIPDLSLRGRLEFMPDDQLSLLASIYHHLRCDGINAAAMSDIEDLVRMDDSIGQSDIDVVDWCMWLARVSGRQVFSPDWKGDASEKRLRLEFWRELSDRLVRRSLRFRPATPAFYRWLSLSYGRSMRGIKVLFDHRNLVTLGLHLSGKRARSRFEDLARRKDLIERLMGVDLVWEEHDYIRSYSISAPCCHCSIEERELWEGVHELIVERLFALQAVLEIFDVGHIKSDR